VGEALAGSAPLEALGEARAETAMAAAQLEQAAGERDALIAHIAGLEQQARGGGGFKWRFWEDFTEKVLLGRS